LPLRRSAATPSPLHRRQAPPYAKEFGPSFLVSLLASPPCLAASFTGSASGALGGVGVACGEMPETCCGMLASHRPSWSCAVFRSRGAYTDLQGPRARGDRTSADVQSIALLTFHAVFPDAFRSKLPDALTSDFLSWDCRRSPLRRSRPRSPLPTRRCHHRRVFGLMVPASTVFRPRGLSPPRRFAPPWTW